MYMQFWKGPPGIEGIDGKDGKPGLRVSSTILSQNLSDKSHGDNPTAKPVWSSLSSETDCGLFYYHYQGDTGPPGPAGPRGIPVSITCMHHTPQLFLQISFFFFFSF